MVDEYGVTQPNGPVTLQPNGNYSFTLSLPATRYGWDEDGHLYTITVHGIDQAGNSVTAGRKAGGFQQGVVSLNQVGAF